MQSHTTRDRLAYPVAAIVALGLVSVPHSAASAPMLTEVSVVRLQVEVTSVVTGIADGEGAEPPAAAVSTLTGTGATTAATCTYPCTIADKFLSNLPENIRYAILPAAYAVAWVLGAVMGLAYLVASPVLKLLKIDPFQSTPAAAASTETPSAQPNPTPTTAVDPITTEAPPVAPSAAPGEVKKAGIAVEAPTEGPTAIDEAASVDAISTPPERASQTVIRTPAPVEATPADADEADAESTAPTRSRAVPRGARGAAGSASPTGAARSGR